MRTGPALPQLPPEATRLLRSVQDGNVLGASRQLHVLGDCLVALVQERDANVPGLANDVTAVVDHIRRTRGASSQAVSNGMALMTAPALAGERSAQDDGLGRQLLDRVAGFRAELSDWQLSVRTHASDLLAGCSALLAYDYSSTVSHTVRQLAQSGRPLRVFVPEARSLDGGRKYLADWHDLGIAVDLVPDSAIGWALDHCDVALTGAETLSAEGGCYNTIGTAVVAHEAGRRQVPFHVLSVLLKTHLETAGAERPTPMLDFLSLPHPAGRPPATRGVTLSGIFPDLDYTPAGAVASVVTERGCLVPAEVAEAAQTVLGTVAPARG